MSERFNSTNDVGRKLYADIDARVAELARRIAKKKADRIRLYTFGLIKPTQDEIAAMETAAASSIYAKLYASEFARIESILVEAAKDGDL